MLTIPVFINHMGEVLFGLWMLVNSIFITGQLFSMGLTTATYRNVARFIGEGNLKEINQTISSNLMTCLGLFFICLTLTLPLSWALVKLQIFTVPSEQLKYVSDCIILCAPLLILKFIEQIFQNSIKAYEKLVIASYLSIASRFSQLGLSLLVVLSGYNSIKLILSLHILSVSVFILICYFILKKIEPGIKLSLNFQLSRVKEEIRYGFWIWLQSVFVIIAYQGDKILVMMFFGPVKLAYYSIVSNMFNHIHMCYCALAPWAFPQLAKMITHGKKSEAAFFGIRAYVIVFAVLSLWAFYLLNPYLLSAWLGQEKYQSLHELILPFTLFELFFVFTVVPYLFCNSAGYEKLYTRITIFYSLLNLIGMIVGYKITNSLDGMLTGLILTIIPAMMIQNLVMNKYIFRKRETEELLLVFVPSVCLAISFLLDNSFYSAVLMLTAFVMMYFVFIKPYRMAKLNAA